MEKNTIAILLLLFAYGYLLSTGYNFISMVLIGIAMLIMIWDSLEN